jgi:hypothetical protein
MQYEYHERYLTREIKAGLTTTFVAGGGPKVHGFCAPVAIWFVD